MIRASLTAYGCRREEPEPVDHAAELDRLPEPAWDSAEMAEAPMDEQLAAEQAAEGPDHGLRGLVPGFSRTNGELAAERAKGRHEPDDFDFGIPTVQIRNGRDAK